MKYFGVRIIQEVWVEVPDELHDQVLADIQQHGTVVSDFKTEQELIEHIAWNRGLRRFGHTEGLFPEQEAKIGIAIIDEAIDDCWAESQLNRPANVIMGRR